MRHDADDVADPGYPAPLSDKKLPLPSLSYRAMVCLIGWGFPGLRREGTGPTIHTGRDE
jgi:hypothetical protein